MVPELRKIYVSVPGAGVGASLSVALGMAGLSKGSGAISILDIASLKEIARLPGGVFPDGIAYAPRERRVFVSDEMGGALTVIDADNDKLVGRIDTKGEVGNVQYDPITRRVYVPVQFAIGASAFAFDQRDTLRRTRRPERHDLRDQRNRHDNSVCSFRRGACGAETVCVFCCVRRRETRSASSGACSAMIDL